MSYFDRALIPSNLEIAVARAKKRLCRIKYDAIAVSGYSGALVAGAFSIALKKPIILVRKTTEDAHSSSLVEYGRIRSKFRYIIVDDFVASGETIQRIRKAVKQKRPTSIFVGVYPYQMDNPWDMSPKIKFRVFRPSGGYYAGR